VKCLWSWCYTVGDPYTTDSTEPDNNETTDSNETDNNGTTDSTETDNNGTTTANLTLCLDENCFIVS